MPSTLNRHIVITLRRWVQGIRFYIGIAIGLLTVEIWWWVARTYSGSSLYGIRAEESYAWLATGFLVAAISIGPVYHVFPRLPGKILVYESRRMLGIGAAWFASLHVLVAYGSLFKYANPLSLPGAYQSSFLIGMLAWLILLAMAFTSFNAAMRRMGLWWFRLHRLVYVAAATILLHALMIGTHASTAVYVIGLSLVALTLLLLHSFAIAKQGRPATRLQLASLTIMTAALVTMFSYEYDHRARYQVSRTESLMSSHA